MGRNGKRGKPHKKGILAKESVKFNVLACGYDSDLEAKARRLEAEAELLAAEMAAAQEEAEAQAAQEEAAEANGGAGDEAAGGAAEDGAAAGF